MLSLSLNSSTITVAALVSTASLPSAAQTPADIALTMWSWTAATPNEAVVNINSVPQDGGSPLTGFELRVSSDGDVWGAVQALPLGAATGPRTVPVLSGVSHAQLRAINEIGPGNWSLPRTIDTAPAPSAGITPRTLTHRSWIAGAPIAPLTVGELFSLAMGSGDIVSIVQAAGSAALPAGVDLAANPDFSTDAAILTGTPNEYVEAARTIRLRATTVDGTSAVVEIPFTVSGGTEASVTGMPALTASGLSDIAGFGATSEIVMHTASLGAAWNSASATWRLTNDGSSWARHAVAVPTVPGLAYRITASLGYGTRTGGTLYLGARRPDNTTDLVAQVDNGGSGDLVDQTLDFVAEDYRTLIMVRQSGASVTTGYLEFSALTVEQYEAGNTTRALRAGADLDGLALPLAGDNIARWETATDLPEGLYLQGSSLVAKAGALAPSSAEQDPDTGALIPQPYQVTLRGLNSAGDSDEQGLDLTVFGLTAPTPATGGYVGDVPGTGYFDSGDLRTDRDRVAYLMVWYEAPNKLPNGVGDVAICGLEPEFVDGIEEALNGLTVWRVAVPAGNTDDSFEIIDSAGASAFRALAVMLPSSADGLAGYNPTQHFALDFARTDNSGSVSLTHNTVDAGLTLVLAGGGGAINTLDVTPLDNADEDRGIVFSGGDYRAGWIRRSVRQSGEIFTADGDASTRLGLAVLTIASDRSSKQVDGVNPIDATSYAGMFEDRTAYVGRTFTADLREGHIGHDGAGADLVRYSISPALPTGLTLDGHLISGIPTGTAAAATYTVTVFRGPDSDPANATESDTFAFDLTVAADPGTLAFAETVWGGNASGTQDATAASIVMPGTSNGELLHRRLTGLTWGRVYRVSFTLDLTGVSGDPVMVSINGRTRSSADGSTDVSLDNYRYDVGQWRQEYDPGAVHVVDFEFTAIGSDHWLEIGGHARETKLPSGQWIADYYRPSGTAAVSGMHIRLVPNTLNPGDAPVTTQHARWYDTVFVFDKPRTVGLYSPDGATQMGLWVLNDQPATDPVQIVSMRPVDPSGNRNGAMVDYGAATNSSLQPGVLSDGTGVGFDSRDTSAKSRFVASTNRDPAVTGIALAFSAVAQGTEGTIAKAVSQPWREAREDLQILASINELTVVASQPPSDAFMPPAQVKTKTHTRLADLVNPAGGPETGAAAIDAALPSLAIPISLPDFDELRVRSSYRRDFMEAGDNPGMATILPVNHTRGHGRNYHEWMAIVAAALMADTNSVSVAEKRQLALYIIQNGMHYLGRASVGGRFIAAGGGTNARKWQAVLAAEFADNDTWRAIYQPRSWPVPGPEYKTPSNRFGEDTYHGRPIELGDVSAAALAAFDYGTRSNRKLVKPAPYLVGRPAFVSGTSNQAASNYDEYYRDQNSAGDTTLLLMLRMGLRAAYANDQVFRYYDDWRSQKPTVSNGEGERAMFEAFRSVGGEPVFTGLGGTILGHGIASTEGYTTDDYPRMRGWQQGVQDSYALAAEFVGEMSGIATPITYSIEKVEQYSEPGGVPTLTEIATPAWLSISGGNLVATLPDTNLYFVTVRATNSAGSDVGRIAIQDAATANAAWQ